MKKDENQLKVDTLIREDCRLKIQEIALLIGVSKSSIHKIVSELGNRKVSARWARKLLADQHKMQRMVAAIGLLTCYGQENGFVKPIVMGDEAWVHHNNPESKKRLDDVGTCEFINTEKSSTVCKKESRNCILGYARHFAYRVFTGEIDKQRDLL
ncbi:hypothetical protein Trydic_g13839 [Trypoxylus dichotomus]